MERLRLKPFRLAVMRAPSQDVKVFATVGLARDGGVFVAPAAVKGLGWKYGVLRAEGPQEGEHVDTGLRPKLHYHRSGLVSVTLTGERLDYRSRRFPPVPMLQRSQIFSVVSVRTWEFETVKGDRKGDLLTLARRWPDAIAFTLSLVRIPMRGSVDLQIPDLAPLGSIPGDPSRFVVDMGGHGERALLVGRVSSDCEPNSATEPGTSVIAHAPSRLTPGELFGLWTTSLRNPIAKAEPDDEIPDAESLATMDTDQIRPWAVGDLTDRFMQ